MNVLVEFGVLLLVLMACWGGLALAKASHQREEQEREALGYSDPAHPRRAFPRSERAVGRVAQGATATDLSRRMARRELEMAGALRRPMWGAEPADRESEGFVGPEAA